MSGSAVDDGGDRVAGIVLTEKIRWAPTPVEPYEAVDLLMLSDDELLEYARSLQVETRTVRALLHEALAIVQRLATQCDRYRVRVQFLVSEVRHARSEITDLHVRLRAESDAT
jgi:hypothetical protein